MTRRIVKPQHVKLHTGRIVAKGLVAATPAELNAFVNVFYSGCKLMALPPAPPQVLNGLGVILNPYGNSNFPSADTSYNGKPVGDCTLASLTTILVTLSQCTNLPGGQLNFLASAVVAWWRRYNSQCSMQNALDTMATTPIVDASGKPWTIGPNAAIDWTQWGQVTQGINLFKGIYNGVDSSPLDAAVGDTDGFVVSGIKRQLNSIDHATCTCDYGEAGAIADAYGFKLDTNKINATTPAVSMDTWGVRGIVEYESYVNMMGEAHVVLTAPMRGDAATWDAVAAADYAELMNLPAPLPGPTPTPTPIPVPPRRPCPNRNQHVRALFAGIRALAKGLETYDEGTRDDA